jgi:hypothetical protein
MAEQGLLLLAGIRTPLVGNRSTAASQILQP